MLSEICAEIKNYFCKDSDVIIGNFSIVDGSITPSVGLESGQYFRIVGSIFNDGVHAYSDILKDESKFHGAIWKMRVPQDLINLASDIEAWQNKNGAIDSQAMSPYTSESFGGYSYSKNTGRSGNGGGGACWQDTFASRLDRYRKIRVI